MLPLLRTGELRRADVTNLAAIVRRPAAVGRVEAESEFHRFPLLEVPDELRPQSQHHRRLVLARVTDLVLHQLVLLNVRLAEVPVRREQEQQVAPPAMALSQFKDRLPAGNDVAA